MSVTLTVHESQYPARIAAQLCQGLRRRHLSSKFLYDSPAQAQRWLAYHQAFSPSRTEPDLLALYHKAFLAALTTLQGSPLHYVSLGCGGGLKDTLLLQQAHAHGFTVRFTPTDVSTALVLETMLRVQHALPGLASAPLVVDLETAPDLEGFLTQHEAMFATGSTCRRLFTCFGMLPNFVYDAFLPYLRRLMRPTDVLLLSANLSPGLYQEAVARILPQYDNPFAHAWFAGLLDSLGFAATQIQLTVGTQLLDDAGHIWQIHAAAEMLQPLTCMLSGESFPFQAGEQLHLFFSNRFTPQIMPQVLSAAGLGVVDTFLFDSQEEAIYLCTWAPAV